MDIEHEVEALIGDWQRERPDLDMSSLRVFLALRRAMQNAELRRGAIFEKYGITPAMLDLLVALRRSGSPYDRTPSELARLLVLSTGGVSQRLARMEQLDLLKRRSDTEDRRVVYVQLTDHGLQTLDALIEEYIRQESQLLHGLSGPEMEQLSRLLMRLDESILTAPRAAEGAS